jgi:hypothetical protein
MNFPRLLLAYPAFQVGLGIASLCLIAIAPEAMGASGRVPLPAHAVQTLVFGACAGFLLLRSRGGTRELAFGAALLLVAATYAHRPTQMLADALPTAPAALVRASLHLPSDAFLPLALWLFVRQFPHTFSLPAWRMASVAIAVSAAAGTLLMVANGLIFFLPGAGDSLALFSRASETSLYWIVVYGLVLPALPFAIWKARYTRADERRRGLLLLTGVLVGAAPIIVVILLGSTLLGDFMLSARGQTLVILPATILTASIPVTTAYAVWVDRVFDVRRILRSALQYGMARALVSSLTALPFLFLAWQLYAARTSTLQELAASAKLLELALPLGLAQPSTGSTGSSSENSTTRAKFWPRLPSASPRRPTRRRWPPCCATRSSGRFT